MTSDNAFLPGHFPPGFEWSEEEERPVYKGPPPPEFARLAALERVAKACERLTTATYGLLGATEGLVYKGQQTATPTFHAATAEADEAANASRDALDDLDGKPDDCCPHLLEPDACVHCAPRFQGKAIRDGFCPVCNRGGPFVVSTWHIVEGDAGECCACGDAHPYAPGYLEQNRAT